MKAYICNKFGSPDVLELMKVDKPKPRPDELLIKVKASTVNAADCNMRGQTYIPGGLGFLVKLMLGFKKPKIAIQGSVLAGDVVVIGEKVQQFKIGDKVFGTGPGLGAYGEYVCRRETEALTFIPDNISYEEAASVPYGALTALYFLKDVANIHENQKVLIKGASGGVGSYAVQLANYFGAEVTGVCSASKVEFVRSLGANRVVDYTKSEFTESPEKWDIILDLAVNTTSFKKYKNSLNPIGMYLAVAGGLGDMFQMIKTSIAGRKKVKFGGGAACEKRTNLDFIASLLKDNKLKPTIDKVFPFNALAEAHSYVESGRKKGNVVIVDY